jgi:hypothetical protein
MSGAIPPLPQYALMAWCSVKVIGFFKRNGFYKITKKKVFPHMCAPNKYKFNTSVICDTIKMGWGYHLLFTKLNLD